MGFTCKLQYIATSEHFFLTPPIVNGSTELRRVEVATVLGEEDHAFQYLPGESNESVWQGSYREDEMEFYVHFVLNIEQL